MMYIGSLLVAGVVVVLVSYLPAIISQQELGKSYKFEMGT